jgi:hypothetical protein
MKALIAIWALTSATLVWANCTTHTYFVNGKTVMCTTCCYGGNCTTNCF